MVNNFQGNVKVGWFLVNIKQLEINLLVGRIDTLGIKCWELNSFFFFNFSNKKNSFVRKSKISGSSTDDIYENNNERLTSVTRNFQLIQSIDMY